MKINIVGWYNENNLGDESFRALFEQELAEYHDLTFSNRPVQDADFYIHGGGGVINRTYLSGHKPNTPKVALGVDIGLDPTNISLIKDQNFSITSLRSKEYAWRAWDLGVQAQYLPDLVFGLNYRPQSPSSDKTIGVILSDLIIKQFETQKVIAEAIKRLTQQGYKFRFITLYSGKGVHDTSVNFMINAMSGLSSNVLNMVVQIPENLIEALEMISSCETIWTTRFHGMIYSVMAHRNFVVMADSGKCSLFCQQEELMDNFWSLSNPNLYTLLTITKNMTYIKPQKLKIKYADKNNHEEVKSFFRGFRESLARGDFK